MTLEGGEGGEVAVCGPELANAVVETEGGDPGVVDSWSVDFSSEGELVEFVEVSGAFPEETESRAGTPSGECVESDVQRSGRTIDFGVGDDGEELMETWPWNRPRLARGGESFEPGEGGFMPGRVLAMAVDEDVGVDGDHE